MPESFDIHDHRHRMKQLRESSDTGLYDNRDGVTCPVCATAFERLFILRGREQQFPENNAVLSAHSGRRCLSVSALRRYGNSMSMS